MAINLNFTEILKEMGIAGVMVGIMDAIKEALKDGAKKAGEVATDKILKKFEERRDEMLAFIRGLSAIDPYASATLLRRHEERNFCQKRSYSDECYKPGDENEFVELLTKLYVALDEPDERNIRIQVFKWLGNIPDKEFDARLEFLKHDVVLQWLKKFLGYAKQAINKFYSTNVENLGLYQELDRKAAQLAQRINQRVQNPSRFGRIAKRLIR